MSKDDSESPVAVVPVPKVSMKTARKKVATGKKPARAVKASLVKGSTRATKSKPTAPKSKRTFPHFSLEEARKIPDVIKNLNMGNPWASDDILGALGVGKGNNFFYLTTASRDYGFTVGTRDTSKIELTELGRLLVYPKSPKEAFDSVMSGFGNVELFKRVYDYYQGENLPDIQYLKNTLKTEFGIADSLQDEFYTLYQTNLAYLKSQSTELGVSSGNAQTQFSSPAGNTSIILGESKNAGDLIAFVAMPFSEKSKEHATGYFDEVLKHLITPAAVKANFNARTAKKAGSEVIQSTIVNDLDNADLVIVDLTEHNPNVLFELGMRIAFNKPVCLIRARGNTKVNKDIASSIRNPKLHKAFPLFHNGITVLAKSVSHDDKKIHIEDYYVVNGCQSLNTLFSNKAFISGDLRVLTKFIQVDVGSDLAELITTNSNNQNGVKARDFKSNHPIQTRLQHEFKDLYGDQYVFEVKRGEPIKGKGGDNVNVAMIRDFAHVVKREEAEIGLFVTLAEPTKPMSVEAVKEGYYTSPVTGASYPKVQILTIEGLLNGTERAVYPDLTQGSTTFKKAKLEEKEQAQKKMF